MARTAEVVRLSQIEPTRDCPECEGRVHRGSYRIETDNGTRLYRFIEECVNSESCGWRRTIDNVAV